MQCLPKGLLVSVLFWLSALAQAAPVPPVVTLETNKGNIVLELNPVKAPLSTDNFVEYVKSGFFDGLIFHRVIDDFMIQGGGFDTKMEKKSPRGPIRNEGKNGLLNRRGTIAMARTNDPHSASSQFFINLKDNHFLNGSASRDGYAVFGRVLQGMDVELSCAMIVAPCSPKNLLAPVWSKCQ